MQPTRARSKNIADLHSTFVRGEIELASEALKATISSCVRAALVCDLAGNQEARVRAVSALSCQLLEQEYCAGKFAVQSGHTDVQDAWYFDRLVFLGRFSVKSPPSGVKEGE